MSAPRYQGHGSVTVTRLLKLFVPSVIFNPIILLHTVNLLTYSVLHLLCRNGISSTPACHNTTWDKMATLVIDVEAQGKPGWLFVFVVVMLQAWAWKWAAFDDEESRGSSNAKIGKQGRG